MFDFRPRESRSWLSTYGSQQTAGRLSERLANRCTNENGRMLTLTYDRNAWDTAEQLYDELRSAKHIRTFIDALEQHTGENLTGRWIAKLEFQDGGWAHWHLIILGFKKKIGHEHILTIWNRGYVWEAACTPDRAKYVAKYCAKPGCTPDFIHGRRARTVRIIRTSPGFWNLPKRPTSPKTPQHSFYYSVGANLTRATTGTIARTKTGFTRTDLATTDLLETIRIHGGTITSTRRGWFTCPELDWDEIVHLTNARTKRADVGIMSSEGEPPGLRPGTRSPGCQLTLPTWAENLMFQRLSD